MKVILYTSTSAIENEIEIITQLFESGADYLYIRKPELDDFSLVDYVESIPEQYWKKCISTSMIITKEFNLGGYHFTRDIIEKNVNYNNKVLEWLNGKNKIASVSAHSKEEIMKYYGKYNHVIVSPLFKSISKENHSYSWNMEELKVVNDELRINSKVNTHRSKLFAVGGIELDKLDFVKSLNFDGVGLLGAIWSEPEYAVSNFNKILHSIDNGKKI